MAKPASDKEKAMIANAANAKQYAYDLQLFQADKANQKATIKLQNKVNKDAYKYQQEVRELERVSILDQYKKSQEDYKTQLGFNQDAADAARKSQNNAYKARVGDIEQQTQDLQIQNQRDQLGYQYQLDQTDFALDQAVFAADQDLARANTTFDNTREGANLNRDQSIEASALNFEKTQFSNRLDFENQELSIGSQRNEIAESRRQAQITEDRIDESRRDAEATKNFEMMAANIEYLNQQGASRAMGRKGNSAAAANQAALAAFSLNAAKISDSLYRANAEADFNARELESQITALDDAEAILDERAELNTETRDQLDQFNTDTRDQTDEFARQDRDRTVEDARSVRDLDRATANQARADAGASAGLDAQKILDELDIDKQVFTMNKKRLGESLVAAAEERKYAMSEIARGQNMADKQAKAARMLPPKFAPDPPRPYKVEMPELVPPPSPDKLKSSQFAIPQPKAQKQSGFSKALGIAGAVLGIAGAAFTGGASLMATSSTFLGMSAATTGAVGIGATAAGSGLGLISQYTQ